MCVISVFQLVIKYQVALVIGFANGPMSFDIQYEHSINEEWSMKLTERKVAIGWT
jgi:hypothetical protein